jgi:hypothetical protein
MIMLVSGTPRDQEKIQGTSRRGDNMDAILMEKVKVPKEDENTGQRARNLVHSLIPNKKKNVSGAIGKRLKF